MFSNYIKMTLKVMMRRKFFTAISLFGISFTLCILISATAFIEQLIGVSAPEVNMDRTLLAVSFRFSNFEGTHSTGTLASYSFLDQYVRSMKTAEKVTIFSWHNPVVTYKDHRPLKINMKYTDPQFWDVLQFNFVEGQPYTEADMVNGNSVAVINTSMREKYFDGEPALHQTFEMDGKRFQVIGVVQDVPLTRMISYADVWLPVEAADMRIESYTRGNYLAMILAPRVEDFPALRSEFQEQLKSVKFYPADHFDQVAAQIFNPSTALMRELYSSSGEAPSGAMSIVLGFFALSFMLLPAINLINLNTTRVYERQVEIGVRKAFGASNLTLMGQFLAENVILTLLGGALGFLMSMGFLSFLNSSGLIRYSLHLLGSGGLVQSGELQINWSVFSSGLLMCFAFALISGVYPAYKMSRLSPAHVLKGGQS